MILFGISNLLSSVKTIVCSYKKADVLVQCNNLEFLKVGLIPQYLNVCKLYILFKKKDLKVLQLWDNKC